MNNHALRQFLVDANKAGYAGGDARQWRTEPDGSTTIPYEQGRWRLHDNFFGGEPYGGRIVVFHEGKPAWMMVYYGWVAGQVDANLMYGVLRNALMQMPEDCPLRGPRSYTAGEYAYTNSWSGDVERFVGVEQIIREGTVVYEANYSGGMVDQRRGV